MSSAYCLGVLKDGLLHVQKVDSCLKMRPEMTYIDKDMTKRTIQLDDTPVAAPT